MILKNCFPLRNVLAERRNLIHNQSLEEKNSKRVFQSEFPKIDLSCLTHMVPQLQLFWTPNLSKKLTEKKDLFHF